MTRLDELAQALPAYTPVIKNIGGKPGLHLTIAATGDAVETLEIRQADTVAANWWAVVAVRVDSFGDTAEFPVAVVYGLALLPAIVANYKQIRKEANA